MRISVYGTTRAEAATSVEFESCYQTRMQLQVDDLTVNFIDLENLKKNKRAVGRLQDLADLENLEGG